MSQPFIIRVLSDSLVSYHVIVEGKKLNENENFIESLMALIASHYCFNVKYAPLLSTTLQFIEKYILDISKTKIPFQQFLLHEIFLHFETFNIIILIIMLVFKLFCSIIIKFLPFELSKNNLCCYNNYYSTIMCSSFSFV